MEQYQIDMEVLFHKNQLMPRIRGEFEAEPIFAEAFKEAGLEEAFGYDLLVQMALHKRTTLPVLVGILRKHFEGDCQATTDALLKATEADLVDWDPRWNQFIVRFNITQDVQDDIDRYQYPLPMVVKPRHLSKNTDNAYYTHKGSVILRDNHHEDDVCLDHLNKMNAIKLKVNHNTAQMIKNKWKHLDKPKEGEDRKDFDRRRKSFDKFDRTAKDVMTHLEVAGGEFYLTHRYDKRGRTYCQGWHVSYQGNAWCKAVIEFAEGEVVDG